MENIDWGKTIEFISNTVVGISAAVVAWIALRGLSTWKEETKGKARIEAAKRLVYLANKLRILYSAARAPGPGNSFGWSPEEYIKVMDDEQIQKLVHKGLEAKIKRIGELVDTHAEFLELSWELSILVDIDVEELTKPISSHVQQLAKARIEIGSTEMEAFAMVAVKFNIDTLHEVIKASPERIEAEGIFYGSGDKLEADFENEVRQFCDQLKSLIS